MQGGINTKEQRTNKILNHYSVVLIHGVLGGIFLIDAIFFAKYGSYLEFLGILVGLMVTVAFGAVRYLNIANINSRPIAYLVVYHLMFGLVFALYMTPYSPFLAVWLILGYLAYFHHAERGLAVSMAVLGLVLLNQSFRVLPIDAVVLDYLQFVLVQVLIIGSVSLFFSVASKMNAQDHKVLASSVNEAQIERQRLMSLLNSMGDGVLTTDEKGVIKLYNAAALNILDTNTTLEEKNIEDVMAVIDQSAKVVNLIAEVVKTNVNIVSTSHLLVYPNGEKINLYLNISPIKLSFQQDTERGFIISFRDITHEKSLEEERNEFISVVSHELRTPIAITEASISNAQFMAEKGNNVPAIKTSLDAAHKQTLFLSNMINDLSTLSRAERGKLDMKTEEIDPREIMKSLQEDYTKEAQVKNLELKTEVEDSTPASITSHRLYLREILQNFITNAIKYTREGSVTVLVRGNDNGLEFAVSDTGIGISKSDQKRVFDKFFRSEDFRTRESSGTGLGLYVTMKLMKLIGAEATIKSKLNEGSTFTVFIPDLKKETDPS